MNRYSDLVGRIFLAGLLAAAISLSILSNAGAYPIDPGGGSTPPPGTVTPTGTSSTYAHPSTVVTLSGRTYRLVTVPTEHTGFMPEQGICCDAGGNVVELGAFVGLNGVAQIAVDRTGRLWLTAEPFNNMRGAGHIARIVELDTTTLEPIGTGEAVPGLSWSSIDAIACGSTCRLVVEGRATGATKASLFAWAPGDASPTALHLPGTKASTTAHVVAVSDVADQLVITYSTGTGKHRKVNTMVQSFA
jgi:hypothetical protein